MRPDEQAGDDVAQHDRLAKALEQHRGESGHEHHRGEILDENDAVHACPCRYGQTG